jgi:3-phenylpropionate/trans-cinnamate dioxygenase ferredoxin subunit
MEYTKVASKADLPANGMITVMVDGREVLLANVNGFHYAVANKCTHAGGSLSKGVLEGGIVTCPRHGAQFNVTTGEAVGPARLGFMKIKCPDEECYMVKVEGEDIFVGT